MPLKNWFEFVSETWDATKHDWSSIQNDSWRYQRYYCVKLMIESSPRYGGPSVWRKDDRPKYDRIVISFEATEKEDGEWGNEINICYLKRIYHILSFLRIIRLVSSMMWNSYTCRIWPEKDAVYSCNYQAISNYGSSLVFRPALPRACPVVRAGAQ